ncbi:MAG: GNAT family N-acetyltransferase [Clostridium sp.]
MNWIFEEDKIYSKDENGELMAEVTFTHEGDEEININHVYVNEKLRGQGVAGEAMKKAVEYLRIEKLRATATCSYANTWLKRNINEYGDVVSSKLGDGPIACSIKGKH